MAVRYCPVSLVHIAVLRTACHLAGKAYHSVHRRLIPLEVWQKDKALLCVFIPKEHALRFLFASEDVVHPVRCQLDARAPCLYNVA